MAWNLLFQSFLSLLMITTALAIDCSLNITGPWQALEPVTVEEGANLNFTFKVISPKCAVAKWEVAMVENRVENFSFYRRYRYSFGTNTCLGDCNFDCQETRNQMTCVFTTIISRFRTRWSLRVRAVTDGSLPDPDPVYFSPTLNITYSPRLMSFTSKVYNETKAIRATPFVELVCLWKEGYPQRNVVIRDIRTGKILAESAPAQNRSTQLNHTIGATEICGHSQWYICASQGIPDVRVVDLNVACHSFSTAEANSSESHHTVWLLLKDSTVRLIAVSVSLAVFAIGCVAGLVTGILAKKSACCKDKSHKTKVSCRKITTMHSSVSPGTENVTNPAIEAEDVSDDYDYPDLAVNARTAKVNNYTDGCVHFRPEGDAKAKDVNYENFINLSRR